MHPLIGNKYATVARLLRSDTYKVLDVGCRDAILKRHLPTCIQYCGLDLFPGEGVDCVCNAEEGLPFPDNAFDSVVALDLLEHTNNIWLVFDELIRVAKQQVIIILPNLYHWSLRYQYARGREMGKYKLPVNPILDRHRWLLSRNTAHAFCNFRAGTNNWQLEEIVFLGSRRTALIDMLLLPVSKNLAVWSSAYVITPKSV